MKDSSLPGVVGAPDDEEEHESHQHGLILEFRGRCGAAVPARLVVTKPVYKIGRDSKRVDLYCYATSDLTTLLFKYYQGFRFINYFANFNRRFLFW